MKKWIVEFEEDVITIVNRLHRCSLYINKEEVDFHEGMSVRAFLMGKTTSGESVKAFLNVGLTKIHCDLYIDDMTVLKT